MQQYHDIKQRYPDTLLFFQVGDFYELFFDDAKTAAAFLGITLTARGKNKGEPIPLCGVPLHAKDHYLTKLVRGGFKVGVCDQLTAPTPGTVVERGVTQVLTPGTLTDTQLLDEKSASYLLSFFPAHNGWGVLFGELMTAQLFATVVPAGNEKVLESELIRYFPDEILLPDTKQGKQFQPYFKRHGYFTSLVQEGDDEQHHDAWLGQFNDTVRTQLELHKPVQAALTNLHSYLRATNESALAQFSSLQFYEPDDFLVLDRATQKNLELVRNNQDGGRANTLLHVMDRAVTAMGSRMIKKWIVRPLIREQALAQRQDVVAEYVQDNSGAQHLEQLLKNIGDLERVVGRIALRRAHLHDYRALTRALSVMPHVQHMLAQKSLPILQAVAEYCSNFEQLHAVLVAAINDDANKQWLIKSGFDARLDEMRELVEKSSQKILALEAREQQSTGIGSLKIRHNNVHGYYIEVTKSNLHLVPEHYVRRQTLVGRERFVTPELQALQHEITQAGADIDRVEKEIFESVKEQVFTHVTALRKCAHALSLLDGLLGFASLAYANQYVRPQFHEQRDIHITGGRHPVIESLGTTRFIPNDTRLDDTQSLWIVTGPNMGGKSTYLRQVALISLMAQCGSFVPADAASLPLLDRIFTRIGAGDNLAEGKSTFLVEMEETATICTQATQKSLVILDEVGRGTSTFDGLAIAQAVVEYLYEHVGARCLFATHYHELALLKDQYPGIESYYAASTKTKAGILFTYKMVQGVADGSFGVEVAKRADLPASVIARAQELVTQLAASEHGKIAPAVGSSGVDNGYLVQENKALRSKISHLESRLGVVGELESLDYDELSPKKAFDLLWQLKETNTG